MIKESGINITKAAFPAPFESGLEYNPPTRGVWNIVHTGMLIPEQVCDAAQWSKDVIDGVEESCGKRKSAKMRLIRCDTTLRRLTSK